jgi:uncharacterized protein YgiM (DUF1202 family)
MEMEQMMALLLAEKKAKRRTNQAKADADLKEIEEEMTARLETMIQKTQERMETNQEKNGQVRCPIRKDDGQMDSQLEKMEAAVDVFEERFKKMDTADLETNRKSWKS